jgi:hypothetical protein
VVGADSGAWVANVGSSRAGHVEAGDLLMLRRVVMAVVLTGLLACGARAQQPMSIGQSAPNSSGWTFNVAPYLWIASIDATTQLNLPPALGGTVSAGTSVGFDQLLQHLNSAVMVSADAQYDRFSILTDFMYMNLSGAGTKITSVNFDGHPRIPISAAAQGHVGMNLNAKIWTQTGGYTLAQGPWGNLDVIAGFRYLGIPVDIDYSLGLTITGPRGNGATFGGNGSVSGTVDLWNGIGGFRGRVRLADTGFFVPYYVDVGTGGSNLTWQWSTGVGYHSSIVDVSATFRYLTFQQDTSAVVQRLTVYGPMLEATFTF